MKLIVGLGNPGKDYRSSRHNIGFIVLDQLSTKTNIALQKKKFKSIIGQGVISGCQVILVKPQTFMNLSGDAINAIAHFYKIVSRDIIVIHDDIDLAFGLLKIKTRGGSAGHRGVDSILTALQQNNFVRIRVGVGRPPDCMDPAAFVLQSFHKDEQKKLKEVISKVRQCLEIILTRSPAMAMNMFHREKSNDQPTL